MHKMRSTANPITFSRMFGLMNLIFVLGFLVLLLLKSPEVSDDKSIRMMLPLYVFPVFTFVCLWIALRLQRQKSAPVPVRLFGLYGACVLAISVWCAVFKIEPGAFFVLGIGVFAGIAITMLISARNVVTVEKLREGWYEVTYDD